VNVRDLEAQIQEAESRLNSNGLSSNGRIFKTPQIPDQLFNNLPPLLKSICANFHGQDRHIILLGSLGVISGIFSNVYGLYYGMKTYPNLFIYLLADYGTGKGLMNLCKILGSDIHQEIYDHGQSEGRLQTLFIPANSSKSGLIEMLDNNKGKGIVFEAEGDSLTDILKQEFAGFSDILRKSYENESASMLRRKDNEYRELPTLKFSVVLSGTFGQYLKLIPSIENGLFSRFIHYSITATDEFKNVFDRDKEKYLPAMATASHELWNINNELSKVDEIRVKLTNDQEQEFLIQFGLEKKATKINLGKPLFGTVHRNAKTCFKIIMILTILNEKRFEKDEIFCSDQDFKTSLKLSKILLDQTIDIFFRMPEKAYIDTEESEVISEDEKHIIKLYLKKNKSYSDIAFEVYNSREQKFKQKVYRTVKKLQQP